MKTNGYLKWNSINWREIRIRVWRVQTKIYSCSSRNESNEVIKLQKMLINLIEAKLLAVRKVTQDNRGKATPGVDGVKALAPTSRIKLAYQIKIDGKTKSVRRVLIPKPGKPEELRPLGIPTVEDRAKQALAALALEPEWEAKFERNSYGFRPGRRSHDAIEAIHSSINKSPKYVLDADIRKCFDQIDHDALLEKLNTFPMMRKQIHSWMKASIIDQNETLFPERGTPQGGVISPLLMNIALHGIEEELLNWVEEIPMTSPGGHRISKPNRRKKLLYVRYADDFVVLHQDREIIVQAKEIIERLIRPMGLELHPGKTRIAHTYAKVEDENPGFKFLGFWIRNYPVGKTKRGKRGAEYKTFIRPHPQNISDVLRKIKVILKAKKEVNVIVDLLNPIIRGWANYFSTVASKRAYSAMDKKLMIKLMKWAKRKHPTRTKEWIRSKYLIRDTEKGKARLRFGYIDKFQNLKGIHTFAETPIIRHVKITGSRSIYDNDLIYWSSRGRALGNRSLSRSMIRLLKAQDGQCGICTLKFIPGEIVEVDHIIPKKSGGKDFYNNLQLVHGHCHDTKREPILLI
jgi:RNA-directed DNA polymerase